MNKLQRCRIENLAMASMLPEQKKFIQSLQKKLKKWDDNTDPRGLTLKQHRYLAQLAFKFRRQLPGAAYPLKDPKFASDKEMIEEMRYEKQDERHFMA